MLLFLNPDDKTVVNKDKPTIKIGANLTLTVGGRAGDSIRSSYISLMKRVNSDNSKKFNYELLIEDNRYDNKTIANITNKFINRDQVNAIVSMWGAPYNVTSEINKTQTKKVVNQGLYINYLKKLQIYF